jgi:hypothetical protein
MIEYKLSETDIYDFAGWLTTRPGLMRVGNCYESASMAEAVAEYIKAFPERFTKYNWKGLTEFEILDISIECASTHRNDDITYARAVEAKLKEKNT